MAKEILTMRILMNHYNESRKNLSMVISHESIGKMLKGKYLKNDTLLKLGKHLGIESAIVFLYNLDILYRSNNNQSCIDVNGIQFPTSVPETLRQCYIKEHPIFINGSL